MAGIVPDDVVIIGEMQEDTHTTIAAGVVLQKVIARIIEEQSLRVVTAVVVDHSTVLGIEHGEQRFVSSPFVFWSW